MTEAARARPANSRGAAGDTQMYPLSGGSKEPPKLDDLVQYVSLYVRIPTPLTGVVLPFVPLYLSAFYLWVHVTGGEETPTAGVIPLKNETTTDHSTTWNDFGFIAVLAIAFLHILTLLCCYWSVHVLAFLTCRRVKLPGANVLAKVVPTANNGNSKIVPVRSSQLEDGSTQYFLVFQKTKYVWNEDRKTFQAVEFPVNGLLSSYSSSRGLESEEAIKRATFTYGNNEMEMVVPEFHELFVERATAPFFVFQVFSVGLWCMDDYWYYSLFTLFVLVAFECTIVKQQLRNMSEIRKMGNKPYLIYAFRQNKWRHIGSDELLPGDLVSITRSQNDNIVPCDLVILRGSCIVDESMLTGESVPLMKESLESLDNLDVELDAEGDGKLFVLFGGTKVVQHTAPTKESLRAPDGGCIGYVIRTGFNTSQGKLLRTILFGANRATENNVETFAFIAFLMVFAVAAASYVWVKGSEDPERNRYKLFLECTLILTSIIPPDLPIELTLAVNTSLIQLTRLFVFCTEPFRIPFAGKVQICCFDKTGTLTTDNLMVEGIAGLAPNGACVPIEEAEANTVQVLACCHSLALLDDGLVGDPLEKATLAAVDWTLTKMDSVIPKKPQFKPLKIIQRYHFSSALKRMSVLAGYLMPYSNEVKHIGAVKGAPEVIQKMLSEVPTDYEKVYLEYARRGARVLALGIKEFGTLGSQKIRELKREEVECDLTFAGFVIISCPMKPDSKSVIKELIQSSHKVVMITGDSPLTACHVAKELRFTRKKLVILTPPDQEEGDKWSWVSIGGDQTYELDFKDANKRISLLLATHDLCITGEGLQYLQQNQQHYMRQLLPQVTVCARFAPKQKEFIITQLKQLGYCTLMCGDGTNDVGALKQANVGVSLLTSAPVKRKRTEEEQRQAAANAAAAAAQAAANANQQLTPRERALRRRQEHINQTQARLQSALADMEEQTMVKLGDASIAAPFTSKSSSIMCVNHIIKQGRCTLVTTLQMFKILALNALIQAYCQSVLYIDGIKFSDTQATMQGIFIAACFLFITRAKPLKTLSKVAPLPNIFNFYTISTILCQFAVHFGALYYLTSQANILAPPREGKVKLYLDMDPEEKTKYDPNIVSSTVYIICLSLQVATIAVNYKGHPFRESLRSNRMLMYAIGASATLVILLSTGLAPELTEFFEIIEFPTDFRKTLLCVLVVDIVGAFVLDRICSFLFGETRRKSKVLNC
ncbi:endoplasmic reticulum transmembrane helix translocase [Drosophila ficusphila]|uniref:endoplasmic reticulum transmembrane helix translocase n=1 Tax=Drosophila ficusphila TaxID=30025 RepID=UPI0007E8A70F|nr:endoplasmic reticulum transmembrane helix translocase [Drosophila ficusphila]